jgi:hypothetical protein
MLNLQMEARSHKHLISHIKSAYITTLIISYSFHHDQATNFLNYISKQGKMFLLQNQEQLNYFLLKKDMEFVALWSKFQFAKSLVNQ